MRENVKVVCLDTGEIFNDVSDASHSESLYIEDILKCCKGLKSSTYGTHWAFYENLI
jgi:hypothetical protein